MTCISAATRKRVLCISFPTRTAFLNDQKGLLIYRRDLGLDQQPKSFAKFALKICVSRIIDKP